jgi:hypothetical protein
MEKALQTMNTHLKMKNRKVKQVLFRGGTSGKREGGWRGEGG